MTIDERSESTNNHINLIKNTHIIILSKKKFIIGLKGLNGLLYNTNNHDQAVRHA